MMPSPATPPVSTTRRAPYWILQGVGWSAYGCMNTLFFGGFTRPSPLLLAGNFGVAAAGLLLSHGLRGALRASLAAGKSNRAWIAATVLGVPACAGGLALVTASLQWLLFPGCTVRSASGAAVVAGLNYLFLYALWAGVYLGIKMAARWRQSELGRLRALAAAREAELGRLRAQFEPHFLFNTLNTISALTDENPELAREAIRHLSAMLRASLTVPVDALVPFAAEWTLVQDYLRLEELRFPGRLMVRREVAADTLACQLPAFALQTLVENALKHGTSVGGRPREIGVQASVTDGVLCILVTNSGELGPPRTGTTGTGLRNLRERLALLCDGRAALALEQEAAGRVVARLRIPSLS